MELRGDVTMRIRIISLLAVVTLGSILAAAGTIYDNGPQDIYEHYGAQAFYGRFWLSDTFVVSSGTPTITGISIWTWGWPTDHALTAEVTITSEPNGGTVYFDQVVQFNEANCYADGFGFSHCQKTANWTNGPALTSGTYWVTLKNGTVPSGNEFFWDENAGTGCQSPGCPSQAEWNQGTAPSEAFTMMGTSGGNDSKTTPTNPKTSSIFLFGGGFAGLAGMLRRMIG
jgi:hypothetical protein